MTGEKMTKVLCWLVAALMFGCASAGDAGGGIGEAEQDISIRRGYGVHLDGAACQQLGGSTCFYPPNKALTVHIRNTFPSDWMSALNLEALAVRTEFLAHNGPTSPTGGDWSATYTSEASADLVVTPGSVQIPPGAEWHHIDRFTKLICSAPGAALNESIPGSHRICHKFYLVVDVGRMSEEWWTDPSIQREVADHVLSGAWDRAAGLGWREGDGQTTRTARSMTPLGKSGYRFGEGCLLDIYNPSSPTSLFLSQNSCF